MPAPAHDDHPVYATAVPAAPQIDPAGYNRGYIWDRRVRQRRVQPLDLER